MEEQKNTFKESLLDPNTFSVTWELVPGRGAFEKAQETLIKSAETAAKSDKIHALTITDNPGGNPAISAEMLGVEVKKLGIEPLVHFTCKDKSRNEMEAMLYGMERANVNNLLVMTGDYPVSGFQGRSRPVFDLDPIHLLQLITEMNNGLEYPGMRGMVQNKPTNFFAGAAGSPFKQLESEQMVQYYKLKKKIDAGAQFIVPQLGYDARKFQEILWIVRKVFKSEIPLIGNIYVLPYGAGRLMNRNMIPGCVVTDKMLKVLDEERKAEDKGKSARLLRAAKMYAFFKGMGYSGAHIGGHGLPIDDVLYIVEKGEELAPNWLEYVHEFEFPMENGFYYFEKDEETGLNKESVSPRKADPDNPLMYRMARFLHDVMFEQDGILFKPMRWLCSKLDDTKGAHTFKYLEHLIKVANFECMDCGDCALMDVAFLCPMSQCPKNQRNGACGGSYQGWCEVYPNEKKCVWVRAYDRLKAYNEENTIQDNLVPPPNWDFYHTSSWMNFFLGRDHVAKRLGIKPPEKKEK